MITSESQNQLNIIKTLFKNNNIDINFLSINNTPFIKKITCFITPIKSINKINLIIKTLSNILNLQVFNYFDNNNLIIEIKKDDKIILNFESYFKCDESLKNKNYIFIGLNDELKPIYKKLSDLKSILIGGTSGSGKSNLLHNIILSYLILNDNNYLMLIDPKFSELSLYNKNVLKNRLIEPPGLNTNDAIKILNIFNNLINERFKIMMKNKQQQSSEPPILLIIDEFSMLFNDNKTKKKIINLISRAASIGRASNCYLILSTQYPNNQNINNSIRVNLQSKIALRCEATQQSYNIIGSSEATKLRPPGELILKCDGESKQHLKACYISNNYLISMLK